MVGELQILLIYRDRCAFSLVSAVVEQRRVSLLLML